MAVPCGFSIWDRKTVRRSGAGLNNDKRGVFIVKKQRKGRPREGAGRSGSARMRPGIYGLNHVRRVRFSIRPGWNPERKNARLGFSMVFSDETD
jgi:hypothetical protein